jgi:hypothetical protein
MVRRRVAAFGKGENMKYLFTAAMVAGVVASFAGAANAAGGCGPGFHRGPYGGCRVNGERVVVVERPAVVVVRPRACPYGMVWRYGRCRVY